MDLKPALILLTGILIVNINIVSAQKISYSMGISATFSGNDVSQRTVTTTGFTEYLARLNYFGLQYFPRIVLLKNVKNSISAGVPLTAGISWATKNEYYHFSVLSSTYPTGLLPEKTNKPHFAVEIPLIVDLNTGAGSSIENKKNIGAYIGGGYAYSYTTFTNGSSRKVESYDPLLRCGIRFRTGDQHVFTIGFSYKWTRQYGVQVLKDL